MYEEIYLRIGEVVPTELPILPRRSHALQKALKTAENQKGKTMLNQKKNERKEVMKKIVSIIRKANCKIDFDAIERMLNCKC